MMDKKILSELSKEQLAVMEQAIAEWVECGKPKLLGLTVEMSKKHRCELYVKSIGFGILIGGAALAAEHVGMYIADKYVKHHEKLNEKTKQ